MLIFYIIITHDIPTTVLYLPISTLDRNENNVRRIDIFWPPYYFIHAYMVRTVAIKYYTFYDAADANIVVRITRRSPS